MYEEHELKERAVFHAQQEKQKKFEIAFNNLEGEWWFVIGIQYDITKYCSPYKKVITIGFVFFSIYIRF